MLGFLVLSIELLQLIVEQQELQRDINALVRTCHHLYDTFNAHLYRLNSTHYNRSALFWGIRHGREGTATHSLNAGPFKEVRNKYGETPLMAVVRHGRLAIAKKLLLFVDRCLNIEMRCDVGRTALAYTAMYGEIEIASLLLAAGAELDTRDVDRQTPLILAAVDGRVEIAELFLNQGAQIEAKDKLSCTALAWASEFGRLETVGLLLERGAIVDCRDRHGNTPLALATRARCDSVVARLLEAGANVNAGNKSNWTALHQAACSCASESTIKRLLQAGADPRAEISQESMEGRTAAYLAKVSVFGTVSEKERNVSLLSERLLEVDL